MLFSFQEKGKFLISTTNKNPKGNTMQMQVVLEAKTHGFKFKLVITLREVESKACNWRPQIEEFPTHRSIEPHTPQVFNPPPKPELKPLPFKSQILIFWEKNETFR
ncbi:hypothetical protein D5086_031837 [Populus alba]|uniref:Uncharacterized protein n=1 Tax=Populus alba TaxID=43335 RepID=A0ACC4AKM5_POPAL